MTDFSNLVERALEVRKHYAEFETQQYGREWSREDIMLGFLGDVGDLAKLVLAKEGVRNIEEADSKMAHELADCLWSIIVLADKYNVDLEEAFLDTMQNLEDHLKSDE